MEQDVLIEYEGRKLIVTREVADFLIENEHRIYLNDRKHNRRATDPTVFDPYETVDPKHIGGRNYLLNDVIRAERADVVQKALTRLPDDSRRLFALRYEEDCTQQQIADMYGVSTVGCIQSYYALACILGQPLHGCC